MSVFRLTGELRGAHLPFGASLWVVDGKITYTPPATDKVTEIAGYIYPGLLDAHTHIGMAHADTPPSDTEMLRRLRACAQQGVTAIRDSGGQRNPRVVTTAGLPKVLHCGQHIARYKRYTKHLAVEVEPADLIAEVKRQCAVSDGWIKIVADWIDRTQGDLAPLWGAELLKEAVDTAHALGKKVTVHTFAAETVPMLLAAKVDGIEHGTGMNLEQLQQARAQGVLITPTVNQISRFPEFAAAGYRFPVYQQRMLAMDKERKNHLQNLVHTDSLLLMGSDTAKDVDAPGRGLAQELCDAVANGMPNKLVMAAASYQGRKLLGFSNWEAGEPADFVVYAKDPEQDITAVLSPKLVMIDGIIVAS